MPQYDKRLLSQQAKELNFIRDTYEKVFRLTKVLEYFNNDPTVSECLALKGGTAINLTIFNMPRLSVDIDFDYMRNNSREEMLREREEINRIINAYMAMEGYNLSAKSKSYHSLDSLVFSYINSAGIKDNIKIETNYSLRCHVLPRESRSIETLKVFSPIKIMTLNPIEIFASKIVALLSRTAARDLYDINNMLRFGIVNESDEYILRKCIVFYTAITSEIIPATYEVDCIESLTEYKIRTSLNPVIRKSEKFDLEKVKKNVKEYLSDLLVLTGNEKKFLNAFRDREYLPELLFEGEILRRIKEHPMALWKTRPKQ